MPFAFLYGKIFKNIDIREHGSGNVGATNVLRTLGTKAGVIVLLLDIFKGYLPVYIAIYHTPFLIEYPFAHVLIAICAILGHTFTVFLSFRGGKGVATTAGVILAIDPILCMCATFLFAVIVFLTKYVSVGSMLAAVFLVITKLMYIDPCPSYIYEVIFFISISIFIIYKHKSNISRLIKGNENKISFRKKEKV
jgi:glycerol-3-phosphate acyltransferase PlsY